MELVPPRTRPSEAAVEPCGFRLGQCQDALKAGPPPYRLQPPILKEPWTERILMLPPVLFPPRHPSPRSRAEALLPHRAFGTLESVRSQAGQYQDAPGTYG